MKIYISGPMTGLPDFNYPAFNKMEKRLKALGFEVFNPASIKGEEWWTWVDYMKPCIKAIPDCTHILMLEGWKESKGAMVERSIATTLGLVPVEEWEVAGLEEYEHIAERLMKA